MNRIMIDLKASFKSFLRSKSTIFWTIAFPVVLILLFGAIFSQASTRYDLYVQNKDLDTSGNPTFFSQLLIYALNISDTFNIKPIDASINATDYAISNTLSNVVVIPTGFNDTATAIMANLTQGGLTANVTLIYDQSTSSAVIVNSIVMGIVNELNFRLSGAQQILVAEGLKIAPKRFSYIDFFLPGVIAMTAMTSSIFTAVSISARFKENGIFHKLATTPLKRVEWILSRTIYNIFISYLGMAVLIGVGIALFGMKMTLDPFSLLLVAMASLMFSGIGMIIARFVRDPDGADAAANVITFPMMFLSGSFFPLSQMPGFLQAIAQVLPLTYVNEGLRATMIFGHTGQAILNTGLITMLGVISITIGALITKWEED